MKRIKKIYANIVSSFIPNKDKRKKIRKILLEGERHPIKREWSAPKQVCSRIVSVLGELYSGSGALVDFLREFNVCTVKGYCDWGSSASMSEALTKDEMGAEFEIFGGILSMERYAAAGLFDGELLTKFLALSERLYARHGGIYSDEFMRLVWEFIDSLSDKTLIKHSGLDIYEDISRYFVDEEGAFTPTNIFAPYPVYPQENLYSFKVKGNIDLAHYRQKASEFLSKLLISIESKECLVLDQFIPSSLSDKTVDAYFHGLNLKRTHVFRDPRDTFATGILSDLPCLPHDPKLFVEMYKRIRKGDPIGANKSVLYVRFEDLVLNYQENTKKIMDFLGLKEENHIHKKGFFDPDISKKNIGLYKQLDRHSMDLFERELGEWLYKPTGNL